jgi:hypothetical protein
VSSAARRTHKVADVGDVHAHLETARTVGSGGELDRVQGVVNVDAPVKYGGG